MNFCNPGRIKCIVELIGSRHFSRFSRTKSKSVVESNLTNEEIDAKIKELQLLKSQNLQRSESPGFMKMIREGFGYGIGISLAQRVIGSIFGFSSHALDSGDVDSTHNIDSSHGSEVFSNDSNNEDEGWSWGSDDLFEDE